MPKLFITGLEGFVGSHLAGEALAQDWTVAGIRHPSAPYPPVFLQQDRVRCAPCNVLSRRRLASVLRREQPLAIVHLAAITFVPEGEGHAAATLQTNVGGSQNLLEASADACPEARILLVSSGEVYGGTRPRGRPLSERARPRPRNLYGVSKAAMELVGEYYRRHHGLNVVVARPFNHIGPGQSPRFVASSFARQIVAIEKRGGTGVLRVGNLESERDFTDVRDVARAYMLLLQDGRTGRRYNVCSGRAFSIGHLLDVLLGLTSTHIRIERDRRRVRRGEVSCVVGDCTRLRQETGWNPRIPLSQSLEDVIRYWRENAAE